MTCDFDTLDVRHLIALSWDPTILLGTWVYSSDSGLRLGYTLSVATVMLPPCSDNVI